MSAATWEALLDALSAAPVLPGAKCRGRSHLFDDAGPDESENTVQARQAQALSLCSYCPALQPCREWFDSLKPSKRPAGVVAGAVYAWNTKANRSNQRSTEE